MKKSDRAGNTPAPWRGAAVNACGILLAFGAAFGGVFLVQEGLDSEMAGLLQGGGALQVPVRSETALETGTAQAGWTEAEKRLTQEELLLAVECLNGTEEFYPHEPLPGQLSMAQAIESGREWLEVFFLPRLGAEDNGQREYRVNCYLWTRRAEGETEGTDSRRSYWTVALSCQELEAGLVLNAVSGQVLEASVTVKSPVEYQARENLAALLGDYAESFGTAEEYLLVDEKNGSMYQSIGEGGLCAVLKTGSIVVSKADTDAVEYFTEMLNIRLYLTREDVEIVFSPS